MRTLFLTGVFGAVPWVSFAGWFGPSDYDECIIDGMKNVTSDVAARLIRQSCAKKFPGKKTPRTPWQTLPSDATERLTGKAYIDRLGRLTGNFYNGNADWVVSDVTISIRERGWAKKLFDLSMKEPPEPHREIYKISIFLPSYASKTFSIPVNWDTHEPWELTLDEAKG